MASKKRASSLLQWVKEMKDYKGDDIEVQIDEQNMFAWNVYFPAKAFKDGSSTFKVQGDHGWIDLDSDISKKLNELKEKEEFCSAVRGQFYSFLLEDGVITQTNLTTDRKRIIHSFDNELYEGLLSWFDVYRKDAQPGVHLKMIFPSNFPFSPPFVRVLYPRFRQYSGHITIGGSICTEALTLSGWSSSTPASNLLIQLRSNIIEGNGKVDMQCGYEYTEQESREAFERVARDHGWKV